MTAAVGEKQPATDLLPVWMVAVLVGSLATATLFATLTRLGDREQETRNPAATRITIGFVQKKPAPPPARRVAPAPPRPPERETFRPSKSKPPVNRKEPRTRPSPPRPGVDQSQPPVVPHAAADSSVEPVPIYRLTALPRFVHKEEPIYPDQLRRLGKEATVKLELLIDADGSVRNIRVLKSAGTKFDQAAIDAIRASRFAPGNVNGRAVPVLMRVPVRFRLR